MKISFGNMTIDLNIFNLENTLNEPFDSTFEVSTCQETFENESTNLNDEHEAEYEKLFQDVPHELENALTFEPLTVESESQPTSLIESPPTLELKPLLTLNTHT